MSNVLNTALTTEQWGIAEVELHGPQSGNPFQDIQLSAIFRLMNRTVEVEGFYDGNGLYYIRFMPDSLGEWTFETHSNVPEMDSIQGILNVTSPSEGKHGPVRVKDQIHFAYADGTPFFPFGTTSYVWNHQGEALELKTLASLEASGAFNKIRMCVFPKHYDYNMNEPEFYPFQGNLKDGFDFSVFNPDYWRHLERRIEELQHLGIEVDLILFHPYDRWGFASMPSETDDFYLRYAIARLSSYHGIWWSLANEYDLMHKKKMEDWDRFFRTLQQYDPYQHLRSIHNWQNMEIHYKNLIGHWYDHGKPWVTHVSVQHHELMYHIKEWRDLYRKPIVIDECQYEGNLNHGWGNITGERMVECFWQGAAQGAYVTHGETFFHPDEIIWWSHGGELHGESPARIKFLKDIMEQGPQLGSVKANFHHDAATGGVDGEYYLVYYGAKRPALKKFILPEGIQFTIDLIDTWNMTIKRLEGTYSGECTVNLESKPYQALRIKKKS
ncbi:DUF5605 domain-containing protein [Paenibacillus sp. FSL R10-2734]|uniref:DUF5605 domain-containing protein n=1 Tax=Paenibacillus sp. FSL R10-2734 TaxID=2954691 RepID=UPI0030DB70A7